MLTAFRNYAAAELALDGRPVLLLGPNGAGKTNLLEALSLLTPGRGLRGARLDDLAPKGPRNDTAPWAVAAEVETVGGPRRLGTGRDPANPAAGRRVVRLDGEAAPSQAALRASAARAARCRPPSRAAAPAASAARARSVPRPSGSWRGSA